MLNYDLDVLAPDEFEQLQAGRVEEVVAGHCVEQDLQNGFEELVLDDLAVVCLVVETKHSAEILECSCNKLATAQNESEKHILSFRCFSGQAMS